MHKVLLTGHSGFLGKNLANKFKDKCSLLLCLVGPSGEKVSNSHVKKIKFCKLDDFDKNFNDKFGKIDTVIHLATRYDFNSTKEEIRNCNYLVPKIILDNSVNIGFKNFISTGSFYRKIKSPYQRLPFYTSTKIEFEKYLKKYSNENEIRAINLIIHQLYGPNDSSYKFTENIISNLKKDKREINLTRGDQTRDFIYVDDASSAIIKIITNLKFFSNNYHEFDLGSGSETSIRSFVETAKKILNSKTKLNFGKLNYRDNELMSSKADINVLLELGWNPLFDIERGIKKIFEAKKNKE